MADIDQDLESTLRNLRDRGSWVRYDSIVVGPGAGSSNTTGANVPGWFNTFSAMAQAEDLTFLAGARTQANAGNTYCNLSGDTEDWAMDVYATKVEFIVPFGWEEMELNAWDAGAGPFFWLHELPRRSHITLKLGDTDEVLRVPPIMLPSTLGVEGSSTVGAASQFALPGHTGHANLAAGWVWPSPLQVPAKGKLTAHLSIGAPLRAFFQQLDTLPGQKNITIPVAGGFRVVAYPNWYTIRVSMWGARAVQLRGARSS